MGIINTTLLNCEHPEGKIRLLNGNILQGYTHERVANGEAVSTELRLDTTGEYFAVGGQKPKPQQSVNSRDEKERFFYSHAFFFFTHAEQIFSDSRMFLAPVPVQSGLAYSGTSGFQRPTLGIYLEWWLNNPCSIFDDGHDKHLVWLIAGSPLSGSNKCGIVDQKGRSTVRAIYPFKEVWTSFVRVNNRYAEFKGKYAAFTLEEVYQLLGGEESEKDVTEPQRHFLDCFFLRSKIYILENRLQQMTGQRDSYREKMIEAQIKADFDFYKNLYDTYAAKEKEYFDKAEEVRKQRIELRRQFKAGEIDQKTFQKALRPLVKFLRDGLWDAARAVDNALFDRKVEFRYSELYQYFHNLENPTEDGTK